MLEKIGLPPKPFLKENEWVVDASHCQSCTSAFSLFNFKHHCRRCGGLFCGNCTQQRMYLRGQGNGPVRICRACKDIEHATRFQPRTAPKNKAKGSAKLILSPDTDIVLKQILGSEADSLNLGSGDLVEDESGGSPSILISSLGVSSRPAMAFSDEKEKESSITPQSLREAAQEEKKNWLALKKQGKAKEATKAFKRGKELEREAEALELSLRNQKKGLMESTSQHVALQDDVDIGRVKKSQSLPSVKREKGTKKSPAMGEKDDLMGALRELGWSDAEIHAEDKKQGKSVESELEVLAMATRLESHSEIAPSQVAGAPLSNEVLAHKRKALALKREGKMAEAKEELKKAKILEKQIEEQEMFGGGDEDSDDEFAALVRSMEKEGKVGKKGPFVSNDIPMDFDMGNLLSIGEEEVDISDTDMGDPEMIAALKSMGWEEEVNALGEGGERLGRGGEANLKRRNKPIKDGTIGMEEIPFSLNVDGEEHVEVTAQDMNDPDLLLALKAIGFAEEEPSVTLQPVVDMAKPSRREKANLQQQILAIKREALTLKRAGKLEEAREKLRKAKKMEAESQSEPISEELFVSTSSKTSNKTITQQRAKSERAKSFHLGIIEDDLNDVENTLVSEEDMMDPELLKALESVGWQDDDGIAESKKATDTKHYSEAQIVKRKKEVQKELLSLKRAALKLRREGKKEEAEEELRKASELESVMGELESAESELKREMERGGKNESREGLCKAKRMEAEFQSKPISEEPFISTSNTTSNKMITQQIAKSERANSFHLGIIEDDSNNVENTLVSEEDMMDPELLKALESVGWQEDDGIVKSKKVTDTKHYSEAQIVKRKKEVQKELLSLKRAALKLRREGKKEEAEEELRKASELEAVMEELESAELELKREMERGGKNEGREGLRKANRMEAELQSKSISEEPFVSTLNKTSNKTITQQRRKSEKVKSFHLGIAEDDSIDVENTLVSEEDMMDPELLKALQSVGWQEDDGIVESQKSMVTKHYSEAEIANKKEVQKEMLILKGAALKLRQKGTMAEAEEELRTVSDLGSVMELESAGLGLKIEMEKVGKDEASRLPSDASLIEMDSVVETFDLKLLGTPNDLGLVGESEAESNCRKNSSLKSASAQKPAHSIDVEEPLQAKKHYSEAQVVKKKREVQKELLGVKRIALELWKEDRLEEAKEELNKLSELELLMKELESAELKFKRETEKNEASQVPTNVSLMNSDSMVGTPDSDVLATLKDVVVVVGSEVESNRVRNPLATTSTSTQKLSLEAKKYYSEAQVAKKKREVQKELLGVKRLALKLRREGHFEEAEEELKKSSELELLMKELESAELEFKRETGKNEASQVPTNVSLMDLDSMVGTLDSDVLSTLKDMGAVVGSEVESNRVRNPSVTTLTTTRKPSLEDSRSRVVEPSGPVYNSNRREAAVVPSEPLVDVHQNISGGLDLLSGDDWRPEESQKSKGEIKKMGSGNASRKLDGNLDGNFDGVPKKGNASRKFDGNSDGKLDKKSDGKLDGVPKKGNVSQMFDGMSDGKLDEKMDGKFDGVPKKGSLATESLAVGAEAVPPRVVASADRSPVHQEVLEHKRKALMLKREGRIVEAKEELRQAKALEREMELASTMEVTTTRITTTTTTATTAPPMEDRKVKAKDEPASSVMKIERQSPPLKDVNIHPMIPPVSQKQGRPGKDRFKLQQESLAHKRKALALRREGKAEEAEAEFELAKSIEMQMEEMDGGGVGGGLHEAESSAQDELLDPQLLAALKGLGFNPADIVGSNTAKTIPSSSSSSSSSKLPDTRERKPDNANVVRKPPPEASASSQRDEKSKLTENIKAMKLRALQLKKAGKQSEALEALRSAKQLQNKLESMNS